MSYREREITLGQFRKEKKKQVEDKPISPFCLFFFLKFLYQVRSLQNKKITRFRVSVLCRFVLSEFLCFFNIRRKTHKTEYWRAVCRLRNLGFSNGCSISILAMGEFGDVQGKKKKTYSREWKWMNVFLLILHMFNFFFSKTD